MVPLRHLSSFWRTLEINLILNWPPNGFIVAGTVTKEVTTFEVTNTKLYIPVIILSTQDDAKLLQQSKCSFKRRISWSKYQPKVTMQSGTQCLDYLIGPSFQGVNKLFV